MRPFFSIIIPTYNRAEKLRRAIESVERQTFRDFELIVCDDGSTDDTGVVVDSFKNRLNLTYQYEQNWGGPARPRNNGIRAAQGEWVCFLDADDWWYPEKLEQVHERTAGADVVYHDGDIYTSAGKKFFVKMHSRALPAPVFVNMMTKGNPFITSGICVKKELLDKTGGFPEDKALISVEDFHLWLKITLLTDRFVRIPRSLCGYWKGAGNISGTSRHITAHFALFDQYKEHLSPGPRREAEKYFSYCIGISMLENGMYPESRNQFLRSLRSRSAYLAARSLYRIMISFCRGRIRRSRIRS
jgi:glycosyltransferase involved in cell wall biosynthesis